MKASIFSGCMGAGLLLICLWSCTTTSRNIFSKKTPHELYEASLTEASLHTTALGKKWLSAAANSLQKPYLIQLPYLETGYFAAEQPTAVGLRFTTKTGRRLIIDITTDTSNGFRLFADLWRMVPGTLPQLLQAADTALQLQTDIDKDGDYLLRIQPELLRSGKYTVRITTAPSLAFPVPSAKNPDIGSFWGASRDNGARRHEGVDIFGKFRTPVAAAANGVVTSVREGGIGGKVLFMQPDNKDYTLYYAHLDSQLAREGQEVKTGEVIGLMGNTGNARTTATHLHFGIYTNSGAVDPLPFIDGQPSAPQPVNVPLQLVNAFVRNPRTAEVYPQPSAKSVSIARLAANTPLKATAATDGWLRVELPDSTIGYVPQTAVVTANIPLPQAKAPAGRLLLEHPSSAASPKMLVSDKDVLRVYGIYRQFYFVSTQGLYGWVLQ